MIRFLLLAIFIAGPAFGNDAVFDHDSWDALLKKHVEVHEGGKITKVDYQGMAADRAFLADYLEQLSEVTRDQFDSWTKDEQLAFLINAYNAWTVELILTQYPDLESIKDLGSFFQSPWKKKFIPLLGETRSLDDIEHNLIRGSGRYNDPRIHFAVNCASIGCPALSNRAYRGKILDQQLEEATSLFLSDGSRNRMRDDSLQVSSIFKWYKEDFESGWRGVTSLPEFLALYSDSLGLSKAEADRLRTGDINIEFLDYDWSLNSTD